MDLILSAIAFLVIFSVIILIHEFGHFYAAIRSGIKVEEFGLGLPPRAWGKKKKGIIWSINWIPFGGFVRLYGEDSSDPKVLKDPRSFASKPLRKRIKVVIAGVFMNLMLAIFLLTIGFSFGIEPLIVNSEDIFNGIENGLIEIDHGVKVKSVEEGGVAYNAGLKEGDKVVSINGIEVSDYAQIDMITKGSEDINEHTLQVYRDGQIADIALSKNEEGNFDYEFYMPVFLPRIVVREVAPDSKSEEAGILMGDTIISMNSMPVYYISEYQTLISTENVIEYEVFRNNEIQKILVSNEDNKRTVVSAVYKDTPADKAKFAEGDIIISINDKEILIPEDSIEITGANKGKELTYKINRAGEVIDIAVIPDETGRIGIGIINMVSYKNDQLSVYNSDFVTSITKINDVKLPVHQAAWAAVTESGRLAGITVDMIGKVVSSIVSKFVVPEGVAGPVGIAQLTHVFAQEGLLALLRFTALLSLSLAVINILPFPALDGGRLLFLLVEAVRGKPVPAKWESLIHAFGFILLLALIFFITYSDILNIFS